MVWSCSSQPVSGPVDGGAGSAAGGGGARAGVGGSSIDVGGAAGSNQAGGGQSAATAGLTGSVGDGSPGAGTSSQGGGDSEGGTGNSAESGAGEGGAGGSADPEAIFDGHCGQGWAAGGAAPRPELQGTVTPDVDSAGNWSFTFGRYRFVVAGSHGARVIEFSIDGINLIDPTQGSTFWPSPQQAFTWPPPAEIDSAAYVVQSDATSLSLTSEIAKSLGLSVHKRFWVNEASGVVSLEYQLINQSTLSASWAPWEVTRVRAGGYTFAPKGPGSRTISEDFPLLPMSLLPPPPAANGIEWLNYPSLNLTQDNYINEFDGAEGWLAHANRLGKASLPILFVKSFVDAPDASLPVNQAEIQIWTSGTANPKLIEVEEQGAEQVLLPGASLSWTVHWSACELPNSTLLAAGNVDLAAFARAHAIKP